METRAEGHVLQKGLAGRLSKNWGLISLPPSTHTQPARDQPLCWTPFLLWSPATMHSPQSELQGQ